MQNVFFEADIKSTPIAQHLIEMQSNQTAWRARPLLRKVMVISIN